MILNHVCARLTKPPNGVLNLPAAEVGQEKACISIALVELTIPKLRPSP